MAGFGREADGLDFGVALRVGRLTGFDRVAGVLDFGVVLGVGRFTDGRERGVLDFGGGEAVGCSRVCRGRAILR